jgi:hypothetical protein
MQSIRQNIGQPAVWRGANFFGQSFADLVSFLNQEIPAAGHVILPPRGIGPDPLANTQQMQYFLFPRVISNCTGEYQACLRVFLDEPQTYLIVAEADRHPDLWNDLPAQRIRSYSSDTLIIAPEGSELDRGQPLKAYQGLEFVLMDLVLGLIFLAGLWCIGGAILASGIPGLSSLEIVGFGFGLGSGIFSIVLAVPLALGLPLGKALVWLIYLILLVGSLGLLTLARRPAAGLRRQPTNWRNEKWAVLILVFGAVIILLAFGQGYHRDDELGIWATKGYGIAQAGFPEGPTDWGTLTTAYPLNVPILIAGFRAVFQENLPESKLIFPAFSISTMFLIYAFFRQKTSAVVSVFSALGFGTSALFYGHSIIAYANLAAAYLFFSGVFLLADRTRQIRSFSLTRLFGSVFLALASWTRPEVLPIAFLTVVFFAVVDPARGRQIKSVLLLASPIAVYAIFWSLIKPVAYSQTGFTAGIYRDALDGILRGEFHTAELVQIAGNLLGVLSIETWGLIGWSCLVGLAGVFYFRIRSEEPVSKELLIGALYLGSIAGGYYLTAYLAARVHPVDWWTGGGFARMILPGILLVWAGSTRSVLGRVDTNPALLPGEKL